MKFLSHYKRLFIIALLSSVTMSPLLTSCGSTSTTTAGIGGTGITQTQAKVTQGKVTGFGSVFVNGVEFFTNQSQFVVDGDTSLDESALSIGMVVKITGSVNSDGLTGTAENVEYGNEVRGPIANITPIAVNGQKSFDIFDKTITIDQSTTSFDNTDFATIAENDIVEISGFKTSATGIEATFVRKTGLFAVNENVQLKGKISNLDLSLSRFTLAGIDITFDIKDVPGGNLENGLFVEVRGKLQSASAILATKIEAKNEGFKNDEVVSLQGIISNLQGDLFTINGQQQVDASNVVFPPNITSLSDGLNVEVKGKIVSGVLIAETIELREGKVKIKAFVSAVDLNTKQIEFTFPGKGSILVTTDNQTEFEDKTASSGTFSLNQVMPGQFIEIEGIDTGSRITASQVKRPDQTEDTEVQGKVEFFTGGTSINKITLFGVTFDVDNNVVNPGLVIGDIVKITDNAPANGTIDQIELED